ncbi:hypothetical protein [Chitinimonas sp.]|uniref:hypothetical protein n=1 Tax=Chitinimonas sp. TaxID=1934313 RepID=UPI0035B24455
MYIEPHLFLDDSAAQQLQARHSFQLGDYWDCHDKQRHAFSVQLNLDALVVLAMDCGRARRIYEFMSICRPGDLLAYAYVSWGQSAPKVVKDITKRIAERVQEGRWRIPADVNVLRYVDFDGLFFDQGDDTAELDALWLRAIATHPKSDSKPVWADYLVAALDRVREVQRQIQESDDPLIQRQLALIKQSRHWRDYRPSLPRSADLGQVPYQQGIPLALAARIAQLVEDWGLESVSTSGGGIDYWNMLCRMQLSAADRTGLPPAEALSLFACDRGVPIVAADWGGDIHVSWEGMCISELTVLPPWWNVNQALWETEAPIAPALWRPLSLCVILVSPADLGERRDMVCERYPGWWLYRPEQRPADLEASRKKLAAFLRRRKPA